MEIKFNCIICIKLSKLTSAVKSGNARAEIGLKQQQYLSSNLPVQCTCSAFTCHCIQFIYLFFLYSTMRCILKCCISSSPGVSPNSKYSFVLEFCDSIKPSINVNVIRRYKHQMEENLIVFQWKTKWRELLKA